jgi:aldehyde dehydrogenase (NAD+)
LVGEVNLAGPTEVDAAVAAARAAYESGPWGTFTGAQRAAVMHKLADLIDANIGELAKAESQAMGQPVAVASTWILPSVSSTFRYYAGWADKIEGQTFPEEGGYFKMTQYEPYGVCAGIGPWNATLM